ncbi:MAG TPA: glycosyltransferase family 2 protein [Thermotogota bacterium]|nr:glycosyltransferase family 2 protein [Thermotogota bacterium]HRW92224.1 glycosyltransferase family 2 protein [Thermotogota bacterium]
MKAILQAVGFFLPFLLLLGKQRLASWGEPPRKQRPRVSLIIPARNEEKRLPPLLRSLSAQSGWFDEAIVVDDHSSDATAQLAKEAGCKVIAAPPLPKGWMGKNWACWNGAQAAEGEVLLFLDADVELGKDALQEALSRWKGEGEVLSVQPFHRAIKPYESLSAVFNLLVVLSMSVRFRKSKRAPGLYGPFLLFHRADYRRIDGHRAVRGEVVEDIALGKRVAQAGLTPRALFGSQLISFRMYPEGFPSLWEGWVKNMSSGAASTGGIPLLISILWVFAGISTFFGLLGSLVEPSWVNGVLSGACYLAGVSSFHLLTAKVGKFAWYSAWLFPVYLFFFVVLFFTSVFQGLLGKKGSWRGRSIGGA